jgi:hypothetical protein
VEADEATRVRKKLRKELAARNELARKKGCEGSRHLGIGDRVVLKQRSALPYP